MPETTIFLLLASGIFAAAAAGLILPGPDGHLMGNGPKRAIAAIAISFCISLYAVWERQGVITATCYHLRDAMDFEANGYPTGEDGLSFQQVRELFARLPTLREAVRVCDETTAR